MKITIPTKQLIEGLNKLDKLKGKLELPILKHVLLSASNDGVITLTKTDTESTIKVTLQGADVEETGSIILPSSTIKLIKKIKDDYITIKNDKITTDKRNLNFIHLDIENYPEQKSYAPASDIELFTTTDKELKRLLEVKYAMGKDEEKPTLNAICFKGSDVVAVNRFKLSKRVGEYENSITDELILNSNTVNILDKLIKGKTDDKVYVSAYKGNGTICKFMTFKFNDVEVTGRLVDGSYTKYNSIIPEEYNLKSIVNTSELVEELDFAKNIETDKTKIIELNIQDDNMTIKCNGLSETVTSKINTINEFKNNDKNFDIAFNIKYITDALKIYKGDKVGLHFGSMVSPCVITNDYKNLELVLPIRIAR